jgi:hypothetical protein
LYNKVLALSCLQVKVDSLSLNAKFIKSGTILKTKKLLIKNIYSSPNNFIHKVVYMLSLPTTKNADYPQCADQIYPLDLFIVRKVAKPRFARIVRLERKTQNQTFL